MIVGSPSDFVRQKSENDGNKNTEHSKLEERIRETYVKANTTRSKVGLNIPYIKAIRWATDRIGNNEGIIGFIHNSSLLEDVSTVGLRKCLVQDF